MAVEVADDPFLLAFAAERDPDEIGAGVGDGFCEGGFIGFGPVAEGRGEAADDVEAWSGFFVLGGEGVEGFGGSAEE